MKLKMKHKTMSAFILAIMILCSAIMSSVSPALAHESSNCSIQEGTYALVNRGTGKACNRYAGRNRRYNPVNSWEYNSWDTDLRFNLRAYGGGYRLFSATSNDYVLDVKRGYNPLSVGQSCEIWTADDPTAQTFVFRKATDGSFTIHMLANQNLVLSSGYRNWNGAPIQLEVFNPGASSQEFYFRDSDGNQIDPSINSYPSTPSIPDSNALIHQGIQRMMAKYPEGSYNNYYPEANAWACHGFAVSLQREIYGGNKPSPRTGNPEYNYYYATPWDNLERYLVPGAMVRYNSGYGTDHTIVITDVFGDGRVIFADSNGKGDLRMRYCNETTKANIANKLTWGLNDPLNGSHPYGWIAVHK